MVYLGTSNKKILPLKKFLASLKMPFNLYLNQNYNEIKKDCLKSNHLFEDDKFAANLSILSRSKQYKRINWKRPHEICPNPKFIVNQIEPTDIDQVKFIFLK